MDEIIKVANISYHYDREEVLQDINLSIKKGSFTGIIGPNGSGKSTLIKLILGLLKIQHGEIMVFGEPQAQFKDWSKVGFVSQKSNAFNGAFPATVKEVVSSGLVKKKGLFRRLNRHDFEAVYEALDIVDMRRFAGRNIGELSGGQQQRVFIARALVSKPEVLILDEPTVGIDAQNVTSFYELLKELNANEDITMLLVTHDLLAVNSYVDHIVSLNTKVLFDGSTIDYQLYLEERELEALEKRRMGVAHCDCEPV
ncbi:zinc ABC transporter ATP-binding protein [Listeria weihenstephanensis FSL R9-0317]|uniref:Zinc ABC transporter ATP-binding protein n=1 Tax=Listeria weihenstephanensis TaxID=1006155 RepID=A0A1S7FUW8_9LIST|nr:metal ABC transporter ATP-binding protein [Listeria weihenstephanensis]AQY51169.1 zinc ABC transporter ATP-binding protein [Listeria weihenstephanensis]EUJ36901.1 zinc ABC transporter ATP-binding protein [Listeria weihenstephanensis FSL R9-0317]